MIGDRKREALTQPAERWRPPATECTAARAIATTARPVLASSVLPHEVVRSSPRLCRWLLAIATPDTAMASQAITDPARKVRPLPAITFRKDSGSRFRRATTATN